MQCVLLGDQLLKTQPPVDTAGGRDDQHPDRTCIGTAIARRHAVDPGDLGGRLSGEVLVVFDRDRPTKGPHYDRSPDLGVLDFLAVNSSLGGSSVLDLLDVRDGRLQDGDGALRHIAPAAASDQVGADSQPAPF